jgi:L-arabinose isomerase
MQEKMMKELFKQDEAWFVTGSQHLYGSETLAQVAEDAKAITKGLNDSGNLALKLVWKPTLTTADAITRLAKEANASDACVGLVTWMHTFSPAKMWIAGLTELRKPFCQLHTQYNRDIPWDTIDMDFMNLNQTAHGGREFGFIGSRLRLERKVVVGHWQEEKVTERLDAWMRAAAAYADGRHLKVARFGDNMRDVAVTEGDKVEAQRVFGYSVDGYGLGDLAAYTDAATDREIDALVAQYRDSYQFSSDLDEAKGRERVRTAARLEIGMRRFLEDGSFGAFTTTFENLHGLDQLPGLACQRLMADGYGFGAEGDWKTAALVRAMKVMGHGRSGGTTFMEDYTYHLDPANTLVLGAHMLEVCPSIAASTPRLEVKPLGIGGKDDPARLIFDATPGPALNVTVIDLGGRFRMIVNEVEAVEPPADLPKLPVARVNWKPLPDLETAAASWIFAGGAHHTGYSQQVTREHIADYASMVDVELLPIGKGTTVEEVRNTIRWNDAYYLLRGGL